MSSIINSTDQALSQLPKSSIKGTDNVFPSRDIINSLIANQSLILKNSNILQSDKILDKTDNWNTLEPQTTYQFNGLGVGAPNEDILATDTGLVSTVSTQSKNNPLGLQIVITAKGLAYRIIGKKWNYLGNQVPNNIDAEHLIDIETLNHILGLRLNDYVQDYTYNQGMASASYAESSNGSKIADVASLSASTSSYTNSRIDSAQSLNSNEYSLVNHSLETTSSMIDSNYDDMSDYTSSMDSIKSEVDGSLSDNGSYYFGVYGNHGLSASVSENQQRLNSSEINLANINNSIEAVSNHADNLSTSLNATNGIVDSMVGTRLSSSVSSNTTELASMSNTIVPMAEKNMSELDSIAETSFTNGYNPVDILDEQQLSVSSDPSNFTPIIRSAYFDKGISYEFTATVKPQEEEVSPSPNYSEMEDVTGTIGFSANNDNGIAYQLLNTKGTQQYVNVKYPFINEDIDTQLNNHSIDVIFTPNNNEKLDIISVPKNSELEPPIFTNVKLTKREPIGATANTNSLLRATVGSVSNLNLAFSEQSSTNNSNIVMNNQIANSALSEANDNNSYLNSAPRMSLAPTYSYADSCSNQTSKFIFLYPEYDNDKEEKAIDWCFTHITPEAIQLEQGLNNVSEYTLVDQVKNHVAGILSNIIATEIRTGNAIADPQNPNTVEDWTYFNYLNWKLTSDYDTSSILNYLNSTLLREPAQEWDGWEAYLQFNGSASECANWLSVELKNGASDAIHYADNVRSLLY